MDVKKTKPQAKPLQAKPLLTALLVVGLALLAWLTTSRNATSVERGEILVGSIQRGDLRVEVEGYGNLRSDKQQLITALTRATVKEIVLKPGALVSADSVIVRLDNPELQQQLDNARQELVQRQANLRQLKLNQQRELLNENATLAELTASYDTARLRLVAQQDLVKSGIVSTLNFKETQHTAEQLEKRIEIQTQRSSQLKLVHQEAINIQQERIKQQQGQVAVAQNRLDRLQVRAGFDGVLQRLSVELGQSLAAGQEVALIGSVTDLIAMIRVPQNQAQQIAIGQRAIIDTRRDTIEGTVARIDPVVVDNTVNVEIALPAELPASARPQLNVDGVIIIETLKNIAYIERPANVRANSNTRLYKLDTDQHSAELTAVSFGKNAGRFIEITAGGQTNDRFILSDLSMLESDNPVLTIN